MALKIKNPYAWGSQKHRLLGRLHAGPITNGEIVRDLGIFNYRDAICEIRRDLREQGIELIAEPANRQRNLWTYRLALPPPPGQARLI